MINDKCVCQYCGKEYIYTHTKGDSLKYCSRICRKLASNNSPKEFERICENCGKKYLWHVGQENWIKTGTKKVCGSFSCLKYCSYECGKQVSRSKAKKAYLENYGVDNPAKAKEIQEKMQNTSLLRYGYKNIVQSPIRNLKYKDPEYRKKIKDKERATRKKKHEEDPEYWHKISQKDYTTKKKHHSFNISKGEIFINQFLLQKFPNTKWQYRSEKYPFNCDFYIPELDLYIEFQGSWLHGSKPYDETDQECKNLVEAWKKKSTELNFKNKPKLQYNYAIKLYTELDPLKRQIARENNLNWIEFFNLDQFLEWYDKV